jgi:Ca-activated chloride channel family protein
LSFDYPGFLRLLFLLIVLIPILIIRYRKCRGKAALFAAAAPSDRREFLLKELRLRMIFSDIFFMFFLVFLVMTLAGPRWGLRIVTDYRRGVDIVLAFDLSRSMDVRDCPQGPQGALGNISRLERGMEIAQELAASLDNIRIGTAIGRGRGVVAVPLTHDSETISAFLYTLDSQSISGTGTNLESLLDAAMRAFQEYIPSRRGIILFSDGEALSGAFQRAIERARRAGIIVTVVGLGSEAGGFVPVETGPNAPDGYLLGADGREIISSLYSDVLRRGAERTGGIYVDGSRNDAARILTNHINSLYAESRLHGHRREANPRWQVFALAAMLCLSLTRIMGFSLRRRKRGKSSLVFPLLLCLILFSSCERTRGKLLVMEANYLNTRGFYTEAISSYLKALNCDNAAPYAEYGLASAFFALEEGEAALDRYREAKNSLDLKREDHPELRYRIYYNMGIIYFEKGNYDEAAQAFRRALILDGSRIEAKRNLELSLLSIARGPPPAPSSQEGADTGQDDSALSSFILFEYLRQKEQEQWRSREWIEESDPAGLDY